MTSGEAPERALRVLLADERREVLEDFSKVIESLGHEVMPYAITVAEAAELIAREEPDVACVVVDEDDEHALSLITEVVEARGAPVIAVLRKEDAGFVARALDHGVAAYSHTASPVAVAGALALAVRRHEDTAHLSAKVAQLETALDRRGIIERAKGILMERHSIDDTAAFRVLREHARAHRLAVIDVAFAVSEHGALPPASVHGG